MMSLTQSDDAEEEEEELVATALGVLLLHSDSRSCDKLSWSGHTVKLDKCGPNGLCAGLECITQPV